MPSKNNPNEEKPESSSPSSTSSETPSTFAQIFFTADLDSMRNGVEIMHQQLGTQNADQLFQALKNVLGDPLISPIVSELGQILRNPIDQFFLNTLART